MTSIYEVICEKLAEQEHGGVLTMGVNIEGDWFASIAISRHTGVLGNAPTPHGALESAAKMITDWNLEYDQWPHSIMPRYAPGTKRQTGIQCMTCGTVTSEIVDECPGQPAMYKLTPEEAAIKEARDGR
jgi:hypothetical protein